MCGCESWIIRRQSTNELMFQWHHQFNGHELGQTPEDSDAQGGLAAAVHGVAKSYTILRD